MSVLSFFFKVRNTLKVVPEVCGFLSKGLLALAYFNSDDRIMGPESNFQWF